MGCVAEFGLLNLSVLDFASVIFIYCTEKPASFVITVDDVYQFSKLLDALR